jgi:hypothetical protein
MKNGYVLAMLALLVGVGGPYAALEYWMNARGGRSAGDLAIADKCVERVHGKGDSKGVEAADLAAKCDRYFSYRTEREVDEDENRFRARRGDAPR